MKQLTIILMALLTAMYSLSQNSEKLVDSFIVTELFQIDKQNGGVKKYDEKTISSLWIMRIQFLKDSTNLFTIEVADEGRTIAFAKVKPINCNDFELKFEKDSFCLDSLCFKGIVISPIFKDIKGKSLNLEKLKTKHDADKDFYRLNFIFDENRWICAIGYKNKSNYDTKYLMEE